MEVAFILEPVDSRDALRHVELRLLHDAWARAVPPGCSIPAGRDLLPAAVPIVGDDLWWLDIVENAGGGRVDFVGRHFGQNTIANYRMDPTGRRVSEFARQPVFARIMRVLGAVAATGRPHRFAADQSVMSDGGLLDVEALALPLGGPDGRLSGVLGATLARPY